MSKSLAKKKSDKKKRGTKYGTKSVRTRNNGYAKGRAFIPPFGASENPAPSMLVRQQLPEMLRIEVEDWHREGQCDVVRARALFTCGCSVTREAKIEYGVHERQDIVSAVFSTDGPEQKMMRKIDALRKLRWLYKEDLLGGLQREYHAGLPQHDTHQTEAA